jgi:hypothetical protein
LLNNDVADTPLINYGSFVDAVLIFPNTYTATSIQVYAYHGDLTEVDADLSGDVEAGLGDDEWQAYDSVTITPVVGAAVRMPVACYPLNYMKLVTNNAASDTQVVWIEFKA